MTFLLSAIIGACTFALAVVLLRDARSVEARRFVVATRGAVTTPRPRQRLGMKGAK